MDTFFKSREGVSLDYSQLMLAWPKSFRPIIRLIKELWLGRKSGWTLLRIAIRSSIESPPRLASPATFNSTADISGHIRHQQCVQYQHQRALPCAAGPDTVSLPPQLPRPGWPPQLSHLAPSDGNNRRMLVQLPNPASKALLLPATRPSRMIPPRSRASKPINPRAAKSPIVFSHISLPDQWVFWQLRVPRLQYKVCRVGTESSSGTRVGHRLQDGMDIEEQRS